MDDAAGAFLWLARWVGVLVEEGMRAERRERLYLVLVRRREWDNVGCAVAAVGSTVVVETLKGDRDAGVLLARSWEGL